MKDTKWAVNEPNPSWVEHYIIASDEGGDVCLLLRLSCADPIEYVAIAWAIATV